MHTRAVMWKKKAKFQVLNKLSTLALSFMNSNTSNNENTGFASLCRLSSQAKKNSNSRNGIRN